MGPLNAFFLGPETAMGFSTRLRLAGQPSWRSRSVRIEFKQNAISNCATGIGNAIISQLGGLKGNKNAIAETIENNVRRTIIKEQLNDPAYYEKMSALLDEIIAARKAKAIEYEEYLKRIADLATRVAAGHEDDIPEQ